MSDFVSTPWDQEIIDALTQYQSNNKVRPYTCGNPSHEGYYPNLVPTRGGLICVSLLSPETSSREECFYIQQWVHKASLTM